MLPRFKSLATKEFGSLSGLIAIIFVTIVGLVLVPGTLWAQILALPEVNAPPPGDPRLEPIPDGPIQLVNVDVFGAGPGPNGIVGDADDVVKVLTMRFPPRVNGQTASDGDGHADMYVLFDEATGQRIDQPPIVEAVPNGATGPGATVPDLTARLFSAVWELQAVTVGSVTTVNPDGTITTSPYDPNDPAKRIDSAIKVTGPGASPFVRKIFQTNIFLNCPIVPAGTTLDVIPGGGGPNNPQVREAFFEGQIVHFVPYDIEDGPPNPQILFKFEDAGGNLVVNDSGAAHLVASRTPGDPFYTSIWEIWTVHVPDRATGLALKSKAAIKAGGYPITSSGIRLDCPVVAVDGVTFPFEDAFALLAKVTAATRGFGTNAEKLPVDVAGTTLSRPHTHLVTEANLPILTAAAAAAGTSSFPPIDPEGPGSKGNVIPLIFKDPLQLQSSGPTTTGDTIRIDQAELDAAFNDPSGPRLPAAFEINFSDLIAAGLLAPEWAPGGRSYQDRLALLGRAFFELVFKPEQGANSKDVSRCFACHSTSASGGAARALYTLESGGTNPAGGLVPGREEFGRVTTLNAGSMWGGGGSELLVLQRKARGETVTFAHGSKGTIASLRGVTAGAFNTHVGIQANEFIMGPVTAANGKAKCDTNADLVVSLAEAVHCDLDGDGVTNEMTVGEVTAVTVFFMTLRVPNQVETGTPEPQTARLLDAMGITGDSVERGRGLFRNSIDNSGAACATCHTIFHPLRAVGTIAATTFLLSNPETSSLLPIDVSRHSANQIEVNSGLASFVSEPGLRLLGDQKLHKLGSQALCSGGDILKTAELWDVGSVFPYMRCGQFGSGLNAAILAHEGGVLLNGAINPKVSVVKGPVVNFLSGTTNMSSQTITITNTSGTDIFASSPTPIRVVLTGALSPGIQAANAAGTAPGGGQRQGAFWTITNSILAGGSATLNLVFENPLGKKLFYGLAIQDHVGYSEAVASIRAFKGLDPSQQTDLINYLRVQLINGKVGEGSGGVQGKPGVVP